MKSAAQTMLYVLLLLLLRSEAHRRWHTDLSSVPFPSTSKTVRAVAI